MCICCCLLGWHRHKVHLLSYGMVATLLMGVGIAFSIFAMFQKNSQIGKIWLAGPTTFTVGLVLCGKVVIDWGPAQLDSRSESDNQLQSSSTDISGQPIDSKPDEIRTVDNDLILTNKAVIDDKPIEDCNKMDTKQVQLLPTIICNGHALSIDIEAGQSPCLRSSDEYHRHRSRYGSIGNVENGALYQGETFVLNEHNFYI